MAGTTSEQGERTRKDIKTFIRRFRKSKGYAPTLQEIADGVGLSSHNAVRTHLLTLATRREVKWEPGKFRTVEVVEQRKAIAKK